MRMKAAVVESPGGPFRILDLEINGPRADEILVRICAVGVCHTDLAVSQMLPAQMFPRVFGHEGAGVVEAVGADITSVAVGDHVVMSMRACRSCGQCRSGGFGYCEHSALLNYLGCRPDGSSTLQDADQNVAGSFFGQSSFAEYAIGYADNVIVIDRDMDLSVAAPFGCSFQTGAGAVINVIQPGTDSSLVVYGAGAVGLAAVAAANMLGVRTIVAVDKCAARLEHAAAMGAQPINPATAADSTLADVVKELTHGGADAAVDTTAVPDVLAQAVQGLAVRGRLVLLGIAPVSFPIDLIDLVQNGKIVQGCIEGDADPQVLVPELLRQCASGALPLNGLVSRYPFTDIGRAVDEAAAGKVVKPVLTLEWLN